MTTYAPYTTKADIEDYIGKTIDDVSDTSIDAWIKAMTLQIDKISNRDIYKTGTDTYKYDGDGTGITLIKDCHTITEVRVDDNPVAVLEYPSNKEYTSRIVLEGFFFSKGLQNVEVDAIHSMSKTLPEDIKFACTVLVAGIYNNRNSSGKEGTTEKIGNYSITYHSKKELTDLETAKLAISGYKRLAL